MKRIVKALVAVAMLVGLNVQAFDFQPMLNAVKGAVKPTLMVMKNNKGKIAATAAGFYALRKYCKSKRSTKQMLNDIRANKMYTVENALPIAAYTVANDCIWLGYQLARPFVWSYKNIVVKLRRRIAYRKAKMDEEEQAKQKTANKNGKLNKDNWGKDYSELNFVNQK